MGLKLFCQELLRANAQLGEQSRERVTGAGAFLFRPIHGSANERTGFITGTPAYIHILTGAEARQSYHQLGGTSN